jgi:hypothetical protein
VNNSRTTRTPKNLTRLEESPQGASYDAPEDNVESCPPSAASAAGRASYPPKTGGQDSLNFTRVPNTLLRDSRLSFKARGILVMILSHGKWDATNEWIQSQGLEGREAIRSAVKELIQHGYCRR